MKREKMEFNLAIILELFNYKYTVHITNRKLLPSVFF